MQDLRNYLGLSPETPGRELLQQGQDHFLFLNGDYLPGFVEEVRDEGETFAIKVKVGKRTVSIPFSAANISLPLAVLSTIYLSLRTCRTFMTMQGITCTSV